VNRRATAIAILMALLAAAALASRGHMLCCRAKALDAQQTLDRCRLHAAAIADIRNRPAVAADNEQLGAEIQAAIETVAKDAGIAGQKIVRISPLPPQRLADSPYKEKPTLVRLEDVTLRQLVTFAHDLSAAKTHLVAKSINIRAPQAEDAGELWIAEVELTYLIYQPRPPGQ